MNLKIYIAQIFTILFLLSCNTECEEITGTFDNGNKRFVRMYSNCKCKSNFKRLIFYENGQLQNECHFKNNEENGEFKRWNRQGILIEKWDVLDGKETGHIQCWFDNGNPKKELNRIDGIEHGEYFEWFEDGNKSINGFFENGLKTGLWTIYYQNQGRIEYNYENDSLNGKTYELDIDSTKTTHVIGQYQNGKENGHWQWFNTDSILFQTAVYKNGEISDIETIEIISNKK